MPLRRSLLALMLTVCRAGADEQIDPKIYGRLFILNQPAFDRMSAAVLERLPKNGAILDLASGPGEPTVTLLRTDADSKIGRIVSTDFQADMNTKAKKRADEAHVGERVEFAVTSADDLSQFADKSFDAVTMNYGLMFVPDRQKSLREIYRVLKPGGFAYLTVWKALPFQSFAKASLDAAAGKEMPPFGINPLALEADGAVEVFVAASKLKVVKDELIMYDFALGSPKETGDALKILAGTLLKQLESEGHADVTNKFYEIVARDAAKLGWDKNGQVVIPKNSAQMLTLGKPVKDDL